uniref:DDE_Tnp_ISL3 domain-containing protein n=1 Tax=Macrostomum lignano TaxID=282301 RepID=A0A1I8IC83_9PLAT
MDPLHLFNEIHRFMKQCQPRQRSCFKVTSTILNAKLPTFRAYRLGAPVVSERSLKLR